MFLNNGFRVLTVITLAVIFCLPFSVYSKHNLSPEQKEKADRYVQNQLVRFIENKGQMTDANNNPIPSVLFEASAPGVKVFVTENGLSYVFFKSEEKFVEAQGVEPSGEKQEIFEIEKAWINLHLQGATISRENVIKEEESSEHFNYFFSHCANGIRDVKGYRKIIIKDVYPRIDWVLYSNGKSGMKYDFIVHIDADPNQIKLIYESSKPLEIDAQGNLQIETPLGVLTENAPITYVQETLQRLSSKFVKRMIDRNNVEIRFHISAVSSNSTMVIDPQLKWSTFFGGDGADISRSIGTDNSGNLFIAGLTLGGGATGFPLLNAGTYYDAANPSGSAFISKFSSTGVLLWSTYFGGSDADAINTIAIDNAGNVFACGETFSNDLPTLNAGSYYDGVFNGFRDPFLVKFDNSGNLLWSTYFGGTDVFDDYVEDIALDNNGNLFFHGWTDATDFPLQNAFGTYYDSVMLGGTQTVVGKLDNAGNLLWSTFYGGNNKDIGSSITADINGNIYITGSTFSPNFPTLNSGGYFSGTLNTINDAYIAEFTNSGAQMWSTFLGGSAQPPPQSLAECGISLVTDANANLFVFGSTFSPDFPIMNAGSYYDSTYGGCSSIVTSLGCDAFILKFNSAHAMLWGTYLGGSEVEPLSDWPTGNNITVDACGNLYVSMGTMSPDFPLLNSNSCQFFNSTYSGQGAPFYGDQVLMRFDNNGQLTWSTFLGMTDFYLRSMASVATYHNLLYLTASNGFSGAPPLVSIVNQPSSYNDSSTNGADDIIIMKFGPTIDTTSTPSCSCTGTATVNVVCAWNNPPYQFLWSNGQTTQTATGLCVGVYSVIVTGPSCFPDTAFVTVTGTSSLTASTSSTPSACNSNNGTATVIPNGTPPFTYLWTPSGQTTSVATNLSSGTYTVTVTDSAGCFQTFTIAVPGAPLPVASVASQTNVLCHGGNSGSASVSVSSGTNPYTYVWFPSGGTNATATGLTAGTYTILVTDSNGCTDIDTLTISEPPAITLATSSTQSTCAAPTGTVTVTPSGGTPGYFYIWNNSQTTQTATGLSGGTYTVTVTDANGCTMTATSTVSTTTGPTANAGPDVIITSGNSVLLTASGGGTYLWSTGDTSSSILVSPTANTVYCVTVFDTNLCGDTDCVKIFVETPCPSNQNLSVPNVFSPNNDGQNDVFCLQGWNVCIKSFIIHIYDRWGEEVFQSDDPQFCWDGTYKGKLLDIAVFVYYIDAQLTTSEKVVRKGNISLIR